MSKNVQTMPGVFSKEKMKDYVKETNDYILPMLKSARRIHTKSEPAYQNIRHVLLTQIEWIELLVKDPES